MYSLLHTFSSKVTINQHQHTPLQNLLKMHDVSKKRGRGGTGAGVYLVYLFLRECCFRVRVNPYPNPYTNLNRNPETAFF